MPFHPCASPRAKAPFPGSFPPSAAAAKLCRALWEKLEQPETTVFLHSCFQSAANLSTSAGLITLLAPAKPLQPGSIRLAAPFPFSSLEGIPLRLDRQGLWTGDALLIDLSPAQIIDLRAEEFPPPPPPGLKALREFLIRSSNTGLTPLVQDQTPDPFSDFLEPRLRHFRQVFWSGDRDALPPAVKSIAGCGPGLTPSSDDWLCGYLASLPAMAGWKGLLPALADTAARTTNDISASLLRWSGRGYFSESVLELRRSLQTGDLSRQQAAFHQVAQFGSSSGYDFLTGYYFGLSDTYANWRELNEDA